MPKLSIKMKLCIMYTVIAVLTYTLSYIYIIKIVNSNARTETINEMEELIKQIEMITQPYEIHEKQKDIQTTSYLTPSAYENNHVSKKEPVKYKPIPRKTLTSVFNKLLFRSSNYYIYIADIQGNPLLSSCNLGRNTLPVVPPQKYYYELPRDSIAHLFGKKCCGKYYHVNGLRGSDDEFAIKRNCQFDNKNVFYYFKRTPKILITIIAPDEYFNYPISEFYETALHFLPVFFIVILISGIFFIKYALKPIDRITHAANKITIHNMHERLPDLKAKDELSRLTKTLNAMLDRLEVSFNEVKRFTSDASHELKTPLTILRGELELALNADESKQDYIMTIASSLDEVIRLQNVVESLLELSRADLGHVKINLEKRSLTRLMFDIVEDAAILAEEHKLSVFANIEPDVKFIFDTVRMHQAIINIIDNAIKYNKEKGEVSINLWTADNHAYIRVSDSGIGIPKTKLDKVFDRFFRVEESRTRKGAGLGLSIVHWIVQAHHGKITVHSETGTGTEFEIRLPMENQFLIDMYLEQKAVEKHAKEKRTRLEESQKHENR